MMRAGLAGMLGLSSLFLLGSALQGCEGTTKPVPSPKIRAAEAPRPSALTVVHEGEAVAPTAPEPKPPAPAVLPEDLVIGRFFEKPMPRDRSLRVAHAENGNARALVYLHGMCGNSRGADRFEKLLSAYSTVVVVRANVPCEDRPGFRWPQEPELIEARIAAALEAVKNDRGGQLNIEHPTLFGYSQGAHRAEKLADAYPERYRTLILGGPPTAPSAQKLRDAEKVAVIVGELENADHMIQGYKELLAAGRATRLFTLPGAHHGDYGASGDRIIGDVFAWVFPEG